MEVFSTSWLVSLVSVLFTQFALASLPLLFPALPFLALLPLAVLFLVTVVGLGRFCKSIAGVRASPPAYVFFSILFTWAVYIFAVRQVVSYLVDIVLNVQIIIVMIGHSWSVAYLCVERYILWGICALARIKYLITTSFIQLAMLIIFGCSIISVDPGFVSHHASSYELFVQSSLSEVEAQEEELKFSSSIVQLESAAEEGIVVNRRARFCRHCQKYVLGFDHHCPAFGNCIGRRNHLPFIGLLVGFVMSEASFVACASQREFKQGNTSRYLVTGTLLFCVIQVLWQVIFIMWHVYCACFNITTDEWINWKKYPEFQITGTPHAGEAHTATLFMNPYDKGILRNLKEFLTVKG